MRTLILCLTLLAPLPLLPQEQQEQQEEPPRSRHELLRRQREKKRGEVRPYKPNRVEEQMVRFDKAETPTISDRNWKGFYPRIAWPARGSGVALGFRYWQRDFWGPVDAAGAAFYSWSQYQHYDVQLGLMPHVGRRIPARSWRGDDIQRLGDMRPGFPRVPLYVTFRYRYLPEEDYYGLGPGASLENRTTYLQEEARAYLQTGYQFTRNLVWMVSGGYQRNEIGSGKASSYASTDDVFNNLTAPGLTNPPDYLRWGTQLFADFRDEPGNPHKGFMLTLSWERFDDRSEERFNFDRFGMDARGYVPLGSSQRILALRAGLVADEPTSGNRIPFFMQSALGGSHTLRGFDSFRWRGPKVMLYQVEYRWEPSSFWELAVFADTGTVAAPGGDLSFSTLEWDYGFGMRFKTYRDVVIRMEIAFSRETTRYFFRSSASF